MLRHIAEEMFYFFEAAVSNMHSPTRLEAREHELADPEEVPAAVDLNRVRDRSRRVAGVKPYERGRPNSCMLHTDERNKT